MTRGPEVLTVCVFAKAPRPGAVKTRLGESFGAEHAAQLAGAFLGDTLEALGGLSGVRLVVATTGRLHESTHGAEVWDQGAGSLDERLERVLRRALATGGPVLALGADTPGLPIAMLEAARRALETRPAVLGPTDDGGFWGLGLRSFPKGLLSGVEWSTEDTFRQTHERLGAAGLDVGLLPRWFDVDRPSDLRRLSRLLDAGVVHAPRTQRVLTGLLPVQEPRVSVVLPVLDEELRLPAQLQNLVRLEGVSEIIAADGGSRDASVEIARSFPDVRVIMAPRGRGPQQNAGARPATGDVLLFLHVDTRLPPDAISHVRTALEDPRVVAGAFRTWTVPDAIDQRDAGSRLPARLLHLADIRSRYTSLPYGDQAIFVRREAFERAGGFPEQALFEDLELSRRLRRIGEIRTVPASVQVSGRRFLARPVRETMLVNLLPIAYRLGVPPAKLARIYRDLR